MTMHINPGDELPIYRQIVCQIQDAIAAGKLGAGDKLLSHRDLAAQLVIAPLTVKKAYDALEQQGLIQTQRGRGTFVTETPARSTPAETRERLRDAAHRLLTQARLLGVPLEEVQGLLEEMEKQES
jgi:GntR family transcriptional regulator